MSNKESAASSGIVVDTATGERHVPSSTRADGSKRKEIRIRPGYQPPEDVKVYKNPSAAAWQTRGKGGVPGAEGLGTSGGSPAASAASNKNAKRREAKKKAKSEEKADDENKPGVAGLDAGKEEVAQKPLDPEAEKEKKARNLKKKLRQARDLRDKKDKGESLLPEQLAKIIKINELIRELDSLGFDSDGDTKP
ncbi:hypothetical protein BGW36DRAFT_391067 [Talaromyces proteolyticus]|uniref:WIBG Mago-binding domain-containing protein n=1 Tax=Talaromyces proteolyticus TaxID=1131652 RepID=A0AAD4PRR4_9EURO|nr:uncharacterized protein BGW36DRAFT_391067 [Talaromyces proteolyticus]KAH8689549.1 hypothetical protein BGW36DRAFT_391067 [Talaromyces proteolyticus]